MANPFKRPDNFNETLQAIERRIEEIETLQKQKGYQFIHLLQAAKNKKELEDLKNQAAKIRNAERRRKTTLGAIIGGAALALVVTVSIIIGVASEKSNQVARTLSPGTEYHNSSTQRETTETETVKHTTRETISTAEESEAIVEKESSEDNSTKESLTDTEEEVTREEESTLVSDTNTEERPEDDFTKSETEVTEEPTEESTAETTSEETQFSEDPTTDSFENPYTEIWTKELKVRTETDYAHDRAYEEVYLGNGEGLTVTIITSVLGLTSDDIIIIYDESMLSARIDGPREEDGKTVMKVTFTGNTAGRSEVFIATGYELVEKGEEATGFFIYINKLDSTKGQVVYVTPTGEKYHFSASCAGENSYATTLLDAQGLYDPCSKCAY